MKIQKSLPFLLLLLALIFSFSGCKKENVQSNVSSVNAKNYSNTASNFNSTVKRFSGKGVVTKINLQIGSVEIDHEEIKGVMPAMIMEFYVTDKTELENLKVGDKVEFVLEEDRGQEKLTSIKKIQ
jgi:Cu/Ag efflux protein CusF